jgi:protein SCO1/2
MRRVQLAAEKRPVSLTLVSISVDPENDTPSALHAYAQRFEANLGSWSFLTGDFTAIQRTSVEGFKLALDGRADSSAPDFGIVHGSHLVLVDRSMAIRGYYRTNDEQEIAHIVTDAARLVAG